MIWRILCTLISMLFNWRRAPGRSWQMEFTTRMVRRLFEASRGKPEGWLTAELEKIPVSKKLLSRVDTAQVEIAGVSCLTVQPADAENLGSQIVYLHGGGYVSGSPAGYTGWAAQLAVSTGLKVIVPDYRLSPEHAFPAAQDDCFAVVDAMSRQAPESKLILMGDSAGAALSICTALGRESAKALSDKIERMVLISPWVDPTADSGSIFSNDKHDIFSQLFLTDAYARHLQGADQNNTATNFLTANLAGLPKTYVQLGASELFVDQIRDFCQRAKAQGSAITLDEFEGMPHVFQILLPGDPVSRDAVKKIAEFIQS